MSTAEMNPSRKHAYTDPGIPQLPEPTYAERVRTLVSLCTIATLSTVSRKRSGYPFGSLMPYTIDGTGPADLSDQQHGDAYPEHSS